MVKNLPAMWKTWVQSQDWEDPLEEGMATHSSILAWRTPIDRGAWQATVHGVAKSWMCLMPKHSTQYSFIGYWPWSVSTALGACVRSCSVVSRSLPSMECSPPDSSVYEIFQPRILEWVAISYSRGSSQPRDRTHVFWISCIGRQGLDHRATWGAHTLGNC